MSFEDAQFIAGLDQNNPPGTDPKAQGDDHLRMIKRTLLNTFPGASKAWRLPSSGSAVAGVLNVSANDQNKLFILNTSAGQITVLLPALGVGDAGWECTMIKQTSDLNPVFVIPPSGTIISGDMFALSACRRCIPGHRWKVFWSGGNWYVDRAVQLPIGSIINIGTRATLPVGFEWADGHTLPTGFYEEYLAMMGTLVLPDLRGRAAFGRDDMGGANALRIGTVSTDTGVINGAIAGAAGGSSIHAVTTAEMPSHAHAAYIRDGGHAHTNYGVLVPQGSLANIAAMKADGLGATASGAMTSVATGVRVNSVNGGGAGTDDSTAVAGSGNSMSLMPPALITNMIVVVE